MKRIALLLAARAVTPVLVLCLFLAYVGVAFVSDEPLVTLMGIIRSNPPLALLLALIPVNLALRAFREAAVAMRRQALVQGKLATDPGGLFDADEVVEGSARWEELPGWLAARGYRTTVQEGTVSARRGVHLWPARLLLLLGACLLCAGIGLSLLTRHSFPTTLIEGEPLPPAVDPAARVERLTLRNVAKGWVLARDLTISMVHAGGEREVHGLYPPGRAGGYFLYPRYLGLALLVDFSAPDLAPRAPVFYVLMIYPPGREDAVELGGTPYKLWFSLESPPSGADPLVSGEIALHCRVVRDGKAVFEGRLPVGGSLRNDGFTLAIPAVRKVVATDFVSDAGFFCIWIGVFLLTAGAFFGLAVRLLAPRADFLFRREGDGVRAWFRAEGMVRRHGGVFHEALDLLWDEHQG